MEKNKHGIPAFPNGQKPMDSYDDNNIPKEDLPQDMIPDEVPRKDGPGGESENK